MERSVYPDHMARLFSRAIAAGAAVVNPHHLRWDVFDDCQKPVYVSLWSRPERHDRPWVRQTYAWSEGGYHKVPAAHMLYVADSPDVMWLELRARCRKCDACQRWRGRQWTARAITETGRARRTWFGTLTLSPASFGEMSRRAQERAGCDAASYTDAMARLHREVSEELTKYVKRVRKVSGARLRYLLVQEAHKSGLPHYHMLVHEGDGGNPVLYRHLASRWNMGFVKWNLIDGSDTAKAAVYACKYINKAVGARVRASQRYGKIPVYDHSNEVECVDLPDFDREVFDPPKDLFLLGTVLNEKGSADNGSQLSDREAKFTLRERLSAADGASPPRERQLSRGSSSDRPAEGGERQYPAPGGATLAVRTPGRSAHGAEVVLGACVEHGLFGRPYVDGRTEDVSRQWMEPALWPVPDPA